jgi:RNA polymerase sigma factor (sigma-70 family)
MIASMIASPLAPPRPARVWSRPPGWWRHIFSLRQKQRGSGYAPATAMTVTRPTSAQNSDFERFFETHEAQITGYLYRVTGDAQSAADLSQETFLRAWQQFDRIRDYERPGAWLTRVATNLALQHLRRRRVPVGAAQPLDEYSSPNASDPGHRFAERDLVRTALLEVPPKPRAMLVLREVYGFSGEEVAETLGMSREAVKVALWRARAQFRAAYLRGEAQP